MGVHKTLFLKPARPFYLILFTLIGEDSAEGNETENQPRGPISAAATDPSVTRCCTMTASWRRRCPVKPSLRTPRAISPKPPSRRQDRRVTVGAVNDVTAEKAKERVRHAQPRRVRPNENEASGHPKADICSKCWRLQSDIVW